MSRSKTTSVESFELVTECKAKNQTLISPLSQIGAGFL